MNLAKLSSKGQVTVPLEVRERLRLRSGDKIVFYEDGGRIIIENAAVLAMNRLQQSLAQKGLHQELPNEQAIIDLVKEIRRNPTE